MVRHELKPVVQVEDPIERRDGSEHSVVASNQGSGSEPAYYVPVRGVGERLPGVARLRIAAFLPYIASVVCDVSLLIPIDVVDPPGDGVVPHPGPSSQPGAYRRGGVRCAHQVQGRPADKQAYLTVHEPTTSGGGILQCPPEPAGYPPRVVDIDIDRLRQLSDSSLWVELKPYRIKGVIEPRRRLIDWYELRLRHRYVLYAGSEPTRVSRLCSCRKR